MIFSLEGNYIPQCWGLITHVKLYHQSEPKMSEDLSPLRLLRIFSRHSIKAWLFYVLCSCSLFLNKDLNSKKFDIFVNYVGNYIACCELYAFLKLE